MNKEIPTFSVIVCLYKVTDRFFSDLEKYKKLDFKNLELILVTEKDFARDNFSIPLRVIKAKRKPISLGEKRDLGFKAAKGKFCAYIDDDAYPDSKWLTNAKKILDKNPKVGAIGGPNITPSEDSFWEKVGGHIYESYFTSGEAQYRFVPKKSRNVSELQGVNLIIRKNILQRLGGFNSRLNSGDDTKVCNNIISQGYTVLYDPSVRVYHHRKAFPKGHLRQIRNMGTHRGFFVKAYPETLAFIYFLPLMLLFGLLAIILVVLFIGPLRTPLIVVAFSFLLSLYMIEAKRAGFIMGIPVVFGILVTHITYAIFFICGFFLKRIEK